MSTTVNLSPEAAWAATLQELELQMTRATFNTWLKDARLGQVDVAGGKQRFTIYVRNDYAVDWLEKRLHDTILQTLTAIMGQTVTLQYVVKTEYEMPPEPEVPPLETANGPKGSSGNLPGELKQQVANTGLNGSFAKRSGRGGRRGDKSVEYRNIRKSKNPLKGFVQLSHYAIRFWQPYVGPPAFALWVLISSYAYEFEVLKQEGPSLKLLGEKTKGGVNAIRGRVDKRTGVIQDGLLDVLRHHLICDHQSEGSGRGMKHYFDYLTKVEDVTLLTPKQVAILSEDLQGEHREWLEMHGIDVAAWMKDARETAFEEFPVVEAA